MRKSRKLLRRAQRDNPGAKLVVSGCYTSLSLDDTAAELGIDLVVPNPDKDRLIGIAADRAVQLRDALRLQAYADAQIIGEVARRGPGGAVTVTVS